MYIFTPALLITSAAATADLFRRWDFSPMEPNLLQKRQLVNCTESGTSADSCEASCGAGYARCAGMDQPICYNESNGESCCGNGFLCFAGAYCDPKGCCPNGVASEDCVVAIGDCPNGTASENCVVATAGPATITSTAAGSQATGSSSTRALGLVLGGLGFFFTL